MDLVLSTSHPVDFFGPFNLLYWSDSTSPTVDIIYPSGPITYDVNILDQNP